MSFQEKHTAHVRLAILLSLTEFDPVENLRLTVIQALAHLPQRASTISLLTDVIETHSRDEIQAVVSWLDRAHVVKFVADPPRAMLLDLGHDIVLGRASIPGIAVRPTLDWMADRLASLALSVTRSDLERHVAFLMQERCVTVQDYSLVITKRGSDVALGRDEVPGIKVPSRDSIMSMAANAAKHRLG